MTPRRFRTPLVGREHELAVLRAAIDAAAAGDPRAVLVAGDAGVGKTRLLAELLEVAGAAGATALLGHCLDVGGAPYLPFTEALRPLAVEADRGGWAGDEGADVGQLQRFDAVAGALAAAGRGPGGPVLLVVEDLHWADQSTRDLLRFLVARMHAERLLLVASYRSDDLHRRHPLRGLLAELVRLPAVQRVDLEPLDAEHLTRYLRALHGRELDDATLRGILERSEGNAYYAQELLDAAVAQAGGGPALPAAIADVLLARVEHLPDTVQRVVRVAAVGGRRVDHALLRRVGDLPDADLEDALRAAVVHHVLAPEGPDSYAFSHALLQEAVYGDLLPGERVRLHAAYARAVDETAHDPVPLGSAAVLAHHRTESHDVPGALVASILAADEAEHLSAPAEAWQQLERALRLWSAVPDAAARTGTDLAALTLRAGALAGRAGELPRAVALARDAAQLGGGALAARARHELAGHLLGLGQDGPALGAALDAIRLAGPAGDPTAEAVWGAAAAARALLGLHRPDEAREHAERARDGAVGLGMAGAEADALVSLAGLDNQAGHDALGRPDLAGRRLAIGGPESLTGTQLADRIGRVLGHAVAYQAIPPAAFGAQLAPFLGDEVATALAEMYDYEGGPGAADLAPDLAPALAALPLTLTTADAWARGALR